MLHFFSVENIAFTVPVFQYPMSYIEFVGTIFSLWSVWLIAKRNILTWPVGLVSVVLFLALFYQIRLYGDAVEQIYYIVASIYGWWIWSRAAPDKNETLRVSWSQKDSMLGTLAATLALSAIAGILFSRIHLWLPQWFPEKAAVPHLDALTTVMSFSAMWLMARQRVESWIYWIIVDVIGIGLYYVKGVRFLSLEYVVLLMLAINGFQLWKRAADSHQTIAAH